MAHIFDVMSTVNGQLNLITKYYENSKNTIRMLPNIPTFINAIINRAILCNESLLEDDNEDINVEFTVLADTGDPFNPVYICPLTNITKPIIDSVPIIINKDGKYGPGIGYVIGVPKSIFEISDAEAIGYMLRDIYFGLLNFDKNLQYKASPTIIRFADSTKIDIPSYDIIMTIVAIACIQINLRAWLGTGKNPLDSSYTINLFTEKEIPSGYRKGLKDVLDEYGTKIAQLRDGMSSGDLLYHLLFD